MKIVFYSCKPGINMVPLQDQSDLRYNLMQVFGNPSYTSYYNKINAYRNIPWHIKEAVEKVFEQYGLTPDKIWNIWVDGDGDDGDIEIDIDNQNFDE